MKPTSNDHRITKELLHELFYHEGESFYWNKASGRAKIGDIAGSIKQGYYRVSLFGKTYMVHRLVFFYHHGFFPEIVDHVNRNPLDNSKENLRSASYSQNAANKRLATGVKNKYKGVRSPAKNNTMFQATLYCQGKQYYINSCATIEEAALAYNKLAVKYFGEFAILNIIKPKT